MYDAVDINTVNSLQKTVVLIGEYCLETMKWKLNRSLLNLQRNICQK